MTTVWEKPVCSEHSGNCKEIQELQAFKDRQEGPHGMNAKIFERLDSLNSKLSWVLGIIATLSFILGLLSRKYL